MYIHNGKIQLFYEFIRFRKSIPPTVWVETKSISFCTPKKCNISLWTSYCSIRNGSRKPLNSKKDLFMVTMSDWNPKPFSQRDPFLIWQSSWICLWLLLRERRQLGFVTLSGNLAVSRGGSSLWSLTPWRKVT